jgi:hypothetical protein
MTSRSVENIKNTELILCECGCGLTRPKYTKTGYEGKYIKGHNDNKLKGTKFSEEHKRKIAITKLKDKNPMWKGNDVGYSSLHQWVKRWIPEPKLCQICNKVKPYDIANISGNYLRDLKDWEWLCRRCHMIKDGRRSIFLSYRKPFKHLQ